MKGLFIGIDYIGTNNELKGCINDIHTIYQLYKKLYGLQNVLILADDESGHMIPTRQNILKAICYLAIW